MPTLPQSDIPMCSDNNNNTVLNTRSRNTATVILKEDQRSWLKIECSRARVRKSRYWGEMLLSPIHCCDITKPPYLLSDELCTSPLHSNRLYVYTVCCWHGGQCFSVLRTCHTDVVGDSSGRSYVTEQGHDVPLLRTRALEVAMQDNWGVDMGKVVSHLWQILQGKQKNSFNTTKQQVVFAK